MTLLFRYTISSHSARCWDRYFSFQQITLLSSQDFLTRYKILFCTGIRNGILNKNSLPPNKVICNEIVGQRLLLQSRAENSRIPIQGLAVRDVESSILGPTGPTFVILTFSKIGKCNLSKRNLLLTSKTFIFF